MDTVKQLIRYGYNFLISAGIDMSIYALMVYILQIFFKTGIAIVISVCVSRILSSLINFRLNKKLFSSENKENDKIFIRRYYTLWFSLLVSSASVTYFINDILNINEVLSKIIADCSLGIFSYLIQRKWVFKNE